MHGHKQKFDPAIRSVPIHFGNAHENIGSDGVRLYWFSCTLHESVLTILVGLIFLVYTAWHLVESPIFKDREWFHVEISLLVLKLLLLNAVDSLEVLNSRYNLLTWHLQYVSIPLHFLCWVIKTFYQFIHLELLGKSRFCSDKKARICLFYLKQNLALLNFFNPLGRYRSILHIMTSLRLDNAIDIINYSKLRKFKFFLLLKRRNHFLQLRDLNLTILAVQNIVMHFISPNCCIRSYFLWVQSDWRALDHVWESIVVNEASFISKSQ